MALLKMTSMAFLSGLNHSFEALYFYKKLI